MQLDTFSNFLKLFLNQMNFMTWPLKHSVRNTLWFGDIIRDSIICMKPIFSWFFNPKNIYNLISSLMYWNGFQMEWTSWNGLLKHNVCCIFKFWNVVQNSITCIIFKFPWIFEVCNFNNLIPSLMSWNGMDMEQN